MPLSAGVRLGAYEILRLIDAGGMGEVYQARDARLSRIVAIKVLPDGFDAAPDRSARLDREAWASAALNHPHICALLDVGEAARPGATTPGGGTIRFLVMEYLDGQTLAERLLRGPLPLEETLRYARELAEALEHAHQRGLVHRDLKPGNVMITATGAKLLDFGLAKPHHSLDVPGLATLSAADLDLTAPGLLAGTFPYMAPECLEGREADARSDVFALGAVIYEMAAGRRAFPERSAASLIGAILHTDPPALSTLHTLTPPALDHLVARCLAKDPESRWQSARDVMLEVKWIAEDSQGRYAWRRLRGTAFALPAVAAVLVAGSVFYALSSAGPPSTGPSAFHIAFPAPEGLTLADVAAAGPVTVSPDGRRVVFAASRPSEDAVLWIRALSSLAAQPLTGSDGGAHPFWSPDGQWIGFFAQHKLKKVPTEGGLPQVLGDAVLPRGGTWNRDGTIVFSAGAGRELYRVSSQGGAVSRLSSDGINAERYWPSFLPDGRSFIYFGRPQKHGIYVASL
jgi:eukaryotic-like serine/threonine-protein kinase